MHRSPPLQEILKALYHALKPCELIQQHVDSLEPVSQRRGEVGIHLSLRGCGTDATGPLCSDPQHRSSHTCTTARDTLGPWRLLTCGTWDRRAPTFQPQHGTQSQMLARARHGITCKSAVHCSGAHSNTGRSMALGSLSCRACVLVSLARSAVSCRFVCPTGALHELLRPLRSLAGRERSAVLSHVFGLAYTSSDNNLI